MNNQMFLCAPLNFKLLRNLFSRSSGLSSKGSRPRCDLVSGLFKILIAGAHFWRNSSFSGWLDRGFTNTLGQVVRFARGPGTSSADARPAATPSVEAPAAATARGPPGQRGEARPRPPRAGGSTGTRPHTEMGLET